MTQPLEDKLELIRQEKLEIKEAIISQGVDVSDSCSFEDYSEKISLIENINKTELGFIVEENNVLKFQKLNFIGTTPFEVGEVEELNNLSSFYTSKKDSEPIDFNTKYYKCISVDVYNKTWVGVELLNYNELGGVFDSEFVVLKYFDITPIVDNVYDSFALKLFDFTLGKSLTHYFKFEDNVLNSLGKNHGTVNGTVSYFSGKKGKAIGGFNSVSNFISAPITKTFIPEFTVSGWGYLNDGENSSSCRILTLANGTSTVFSMTLDNHSEYKSAVYSGATDEWFRTTTNPSLGVWHHLVATYSNGVLKLYLDGVLENQASTAINISSVNTLIIGQLWCNPSYKYANTENSLIDEVGFWSRALSENETIELYNNGNARTIEEITQNDFSDANPVFGDSFFKCVTVDQTNKKWSGKRVVFSGTGYSLEETVTTALDYDSIIPMVDNFYNHNATANISSFSISDIPSDGLVFYASLTNLTEAETGHSFTAYGSPAITNDLTLNQNVLSLNGSSGLNGVATNFPTGNSTRTVSFWMKLNSNLSYSLGLIWGVNNANNIFGIGINSDNKIKVVGSGEAYTDLSINNSIDWTKWNCIVVEHNETTGAQTIFVNNEIVSVVSRTRNTSSGANFCIGSYFQLEGSTNGFISSIRVYNRTLTKDELQKINSEFHIE